MRISSASISARGITGIFSSRARTTSGFANLTADEMTTTSTFGPTRSAWWPSAICAPRSVRRSVVSLAARSDPLTVEPEVQQHLGDAAHADAADADEVDVALPAGQLHRAPRASVPARA